MIASNVRVVSLMALLLAATTLPANGETTRAPKPTVLYLHGEDQIGEIGLYQRRQGPKFHPMDETPARDDLPRSQFVTNYVLGPNPGCNGNPMLPVWLGKLNGKIQGQMTVVIHTVAAETVPLVLDLFSDIYYESGADAVCSDYRPAATARVTVPAGVSLTEIRLNAHNLRVRSHIALQVSVAFPSPAQVRLLYDSKEYDARVSFRCSPPKDQVSCV